MLAIDFICSLTRFGDFLLFFVCLCWKASGLSQNPDIHGGDTPDILNLPGFCFLKIKVLGSS